MDMQEESLPTAPVAPVIRQRRTIVNINEERFQIVYDSARKREVAIQIGFFLESSSPRTIPVIHPLHNGETCDVPVVAAFPYEFRDSECETMISTRYLLLSPSVLPVSHTNDLDGTLNYADDEIRRMGPVPKHGRDRESIVDEMTIFVPHPSEGIITRADPSQRDSPLDRRSPPKIPIPADWSDALAIRAFFSALAGRAR